MFWIGFFTAHLLWLILLEWRIGLIRDWLKRNEDENTD
jgi:hypothetical protein